MIWFILFSWQGIAFFPNTKLIPDNVKKRQSENLTGNM